jgi:hypothetical protein
LIGLFDKANIEGTFSVKRYLLTNNGLFNCYKQIEGVVFLTDNVMLLPDFQMNTLILHSGNRQAFAGGLSEKLKRQHK